MGIITTIFIGLIIGIIAKLLMPGRDPGGWITTILLGLAGSVLAGYFGRLIGWYPAGHAAGFIPSILGAIALLTAYRLLRGGSGRGGRGGGNGGNITGTGNGGFGGGGRLGD